MGVGNGEPRVLWLFVCPWQWCAASIAALPFGPKMFAPWILQVFELEVGFGEAEFFALIDEYCAVEAGEERVEHGGVGVPPRR